MMREILEIIDKLYYNIGTVDKCSEFLSKLNVILLKHNVEIFVESNDYDYVYI